VTRCPQSALLILPWSFLTRGAINKQNFHFVSSEVVLRGGTLPWAARASIVLSTTPPLLSSSEPCETDLASNQLVLSQNTFLFVQTRHLRPATTNHRSAVLGFETRTISVRLQLHHDKSHSFNFMNSQTSGKRSHDAESVPTMHRGVKPITQLHGAVQIRKTTVEIVETTKSLSAIHAKVHSGLREQLVRREREMQEKKRQMEIQQQQKREAMEKPKPPQSALLALIPQLMAVQTNPVKSRKSFSTFIQVAGSPLLSFAMGEISELVGEPGSGKTSIVMAAVSQCVARCAHGDQLGPEAIVIGK